MPKISVADQEEQEALVDADLDTLATALYVRTDDLLKASPGRAPWRPAIGFEPRITDAEMITLAVMQALLQFRSETRWLRLWVPETRLPPAHLLHRRRPQPGMIRRWRCGCDT